MSLVERGSNVKLLAIINTIRQWLFEPQSSLGFYYQSEFDPDDITTYTSLDQIGLYGCLKNMFKPTQPTT
jgi:hypothetical protein